MVVVNIGDGKVEREREIYMNIFVCCISISICTCKKIVFCTLGEAFVTYREHKRYFQCVGTW